MAMDNVIDSLVVQVKLDPTQFQAATKTVNESITNTRKTIEDQGKHFEESTAKMGEGLLNVGKKALGLFGLFLSAEGLKTFISQTTAANSALGRLGDNLKTSPQAIRAWGSAAETLGGSVEATAGSFQAFSDAIQSLHTQGEALPTTFYQLQAFSGKLIDVAHGPEQAFKSLADAIHSAYEIDPAKANFLARSLGFLDPSTINLMEKYGSGLKTVVDQLNKYAPTDEQINNSKKLQESWSLMATSAEALGRALTDRMTPALITANAALKWFLDATRDGTISLPDDFVRVKPKGLGTSNESAQELQDWWKNRQSGGSALIPITGPQIAEAITGRKVPDEHGAPIPSWDSGNRLSRQAAAALAHVSREDLPYLNSPNLQGIGAGSGKDLTVDGRAVTLGNPVQVTVVGSGGGEGGGGFWATIGRAFDNLTSGGTASAAPAAAPSGGGGGWHWPWSGGGDKGSTSRIDDVNDPSFLTTPDRGKGGRTALAMKTAMDQLRAEGVPESNLRPAAALLVGQALSESDLKPETSHDGGIGYGIYGANGTRLSKMLTWLKANGYSRNSLVGQMRYMAHEAMNDPAYGPSRTALMGANDGSLGSGSAILTHNFESPAVDNDRSGATFSAFKTGPDVAPPPSSGGSGGFFVIGDSTGKRLMNANGWAGNATERETPAQIFDRVRVLQWKDVKDRKIVISAGSNDTSQIGRIGDMIDWVTRLGVKPENITVVGMGDRPDLAAHNKDLQGIVAGHKGVHFVPMGPTDDHVHEKDPKGLGDQIRRIWGDPKAQNYDRMSRNSSAVDWAHASLAARNAVIGTSAVATSNHTSHEMNVGNVTINTRATDATGIAGSFSDALERERLAASANYGIA